MKKLFLVLLLVVPQVVLAQVSLPYEEQGVLDNAPYHIKVPQNWNGTLLVYVRGTTRTTDPVGLNPLVGLPGNPVVVQQNAAELENRLLADGYALAASAFDADSGIWFLREGIHDTLRLTNYFKAKIGHPAQTILWSRSQGTVIGLDAAESSPGHYDASIAGCAIGAGSPRAWDITLDLLVAWKAAFGFPSSWGNPGDIRDDISFANDVVPVILGNLTNPSKLGLFEFLRLVNRMPQAGFYPGPGTPPEASWLLSLMFFSTQVRGEVEGKAKGRVVQNLDHVYTLSNEDRTYLASLGVDADTLLAQMNNPASKFSAEKHARNYNERYAEYTGRLRMPVLTLHNTQDGLVFTSHESAYRKTVTDAGNQSKLVQLFGDGAGHCSFSPNQWYEVVKAMTSWLDTGQRPGPQFFPDFNLNFVPPAFPNP